MSRCDVGSIVIELPLPPRELHPNARATWRAKMTPRKQYRYQCGVITLSSLNGAGGFESAAIALDYRFALSSHWKPHDPDNLIAWAKTAIDGMQDGGLLANDKCVVYLPPSQGTSDKPGLFVEAWPMSAHSRLCPLCRQESIG